MPDAGQHEGHDARHEPDVRHVLLQCPRRLLPVLRRVQRGPDLPVLRDLQDLQPEKFKAQYEAELAAKRAEKKKKRTVTVEQNGKQVEKEVTLGEANKLRLEMARQREAELYKDERTTPLNKD